MAELARQALLPYPNAAVYELVNDVERYPEFVPGVAHVTVLSQSGTEVVATVLAEARGFSEAFTTRNRLASGERIELEMLEGPFSHLSGAWQFTALGEQGCKVELSLRFLGSKGSERARVDELALDLPVDVLPPEGVEGRLGSSAPETDPEAESGAEPTLPGAAWDESTTGRWSLWVAALGALGLIGALVLHSLRRR